MTDYETRLDALKTKYPFSKWIETGLPQYTKKACAACAAIFDTLLHDLGALGEHADEPGKLAAFRKAIRALNTLNEHDDRLIETGEREELCALCNTIATVAGIDPTDYGGGEGPASEWREW